MKERRRRLAVVIFLILSLVSGYIFEATNNSVQPVSQVSDNVLGTSQSADPNVINSENASTALEKLEVKGRAPKTGYKRSQFGDGWASAGMCDMRNYVLKRDMTTVTVKSSTDCTVLTGVLTDPYTAKVITFQRGQDTSDDVQIDHVVALSDAWQKGGQQLSSEDRLRFANDSLNLLAVEGKANSNKSDSDAASWLPPNKDYRCRYVARQIAVKAKYRLWVTEAEKSAMNKVLSSCPDQVLPLVEG